jgi:UDP-2-acetamido-3-amino-2,3-dideoxy-glucuronate N-acetyltransferase
MIQPETAIEARTYKMVFDERMGSLESAAATGSTPRTVRLTSIAETRGTLMAADGDECLPFPAVRYFLVRDVPPGAVRAQHALRRGQELISCLAGGCTVELWWHGGHTVQRLEEPDTALFVPRWVWVECGEFSEDALLLVLCSQPYDPGDHITDFAEFEAGPPRSP